MAIGALNRAVIALFTGIVLAYAVVVCVSPAGAAPASEPVAAPRPAAKPAHKPKPKRERPPKPAKADEPKLGEVTNSAGEALDVSDGACKENLEIAAKQGLTLPDGWGIKCVGPGLDWNGNSHWGVTCPYDSCPEGAGPYISISNPTYYVVAHELCHANNGNDELAADACAAEHGASLEASPYQ